MTHAARYEQQFLDALKAIFIGARVEGESGYINLMRLKAAYFERSVFPRLRQEIDAACRPFLPAFREELFDKLHDFFSRYFSESGSLYFRHTAPHHSVYERIYSDDRDVMLFWKTQMLYYVKTDRLFHSLEVSVDGERFFFDVSQLEHKRANEKRELVYEFHRREKDGRLLFYVAYSERGRKTKTAEILSAVSQTGVPLAAETLAKACRVFEKQAEVDYFINKDARAFLQEQFDLWLYQYLFKGDTQFDETRLKQLQTLKAIAYTLIDYIAHFEDELVRIWNKPKFVLDSHYILTLDKISQTSPDLLADLFAHPGMAAQAAEWRHLGMIDDALADTPAGLLARLQIADLTGAPAYPAFHYLPLDTRYFPDRERDILALFDDPTTGSGQGLDAVLDGWLVHSENYQALNTILPKFQGQIQCIHIDPPYNTDTSGFLYTNAYQHSSWLTMMENRISIGRMFMNPNGSLLLHVDENEFDHLYSMLRVLNFQYLGTAIWDKRNPMMGSKGLAIQHEYIFFASNKVKQFVISNQNRRKIYEQARLIIKKHGTINQEARNEFRNWVVNAKGLTEGDRAYSLLEDDGRVYRLVAMTWPNPSSPPAEFFVPLIHPITKKPCPVPSRGWSRSPQRMKELLDKNEIEFGKDETTQPQRKVYLSKHAQTPLSSIIYNGRKGKQELERLGHEFSYSHPVSLYEQLIDSTLDKEYGMTLDFFAGSGTTAHAVMNLNRADGGRRKYILVEMGEHFHTVILPRIKKVAFSDQWKNGLPQGGQGMSHFVKYYALEQYEDTLRRAHYDDGSAPLFAHAAADMGRYLFLRDRKLLDAVDIDRQQNQVNVQIQKLYPGIDLAETLSCLTGKWIKRITAETVEFRDGTTASLSQPDWELVKPLLWW